MDESLLVDDNMVVSLAYVLYVDDEIADSADVLKRNRGRRGLDILNQIKKKSKDELIILTEDFEEINEVDSKLVKLARTHGYKIITHLSEFDKNYSSLVDLEEKKDEFYNAIKQKYDNVKKEHKDIKIPESIKVIPMMPSNEMKSFYQKQLSSQHLKCDFDHKIYLISSIM